MKVTIENKGKIIKSFECENIALASSNGISAFMGECTIQAPLEIPALILDRCYEVLNEFIEKSNLSNNEKISKFSFDSFINRVINYHDTINNEYDRQVTEHLNKHPDNIVVDVKGLMDQLNNKPFNPLNDYLTDLDKLFEDDEEDEDNSDL